MDYGLKEKRALVTGGTHGIGRAIGLCLAQEGAKVAVFSRSCERVEAMKQELEALGGDVIAMVADVMHADACQNVMDAIVKQWGGIDIVVNNVGGGGRWGSEHVEETKERVWSEVFEKNTMSAVKFTTWALPFMRKEKWGRVINITSIFGREAGGRPWFAMAKAAQTAMMKTMAKQKELIQDGVTFNSVAPGAIMIPDTGWEREMKENSSQYQAFVDQNLPLGRLGTPEEVAHLVTFICSEKARFLNGASIPIDGGQSNSIL
ncbi:SDR family NAD(P)-dependent oxidoreductase [Candidatus Omnitrophota bacterium]